MGCAVEARMLRAVEVEARLPNPAWLAFLSGDLTPADWALIERVENGEVSVDAAMAGRGL
jgi:hypothetical protein